VTTYRDEEGEVFTEVEMRNQWSRDVASMDLDEDEDLDDPASQHSFNAGWPTCSTGVATPRSTMTRTASQRRTTLSGQQRRRQAAAR
jgi:hypothetical protein